MISSQHKSQNKTIWIAPIIIKRGARDSGPGQGRINIVIDRTGSIKGENITGITLWFPRRENESYSLVRNLQQINLICIAVEGYMYTIDGKTMSALLLMKKSTNCACCHSYYCDFFDQRQDFELPIFNNCGISCINDKAKIYVQVEDPTLFAKQEWIATKNRFMIVTVK